MERFSNLLREYIRAVVNANEINELKVGELKRALGGAEEKKSSRKREKITKAAGKTAAKLGGKAILSLIPGASAIADAIEVGMDIKDVYDTTKDSDPKTKRKDPVMDVLTVDPDVSTVVDDDIENEFLRNLAAGVEGLPDDAEIPDADEEFTKYLKDKYMISITK